MSEMMYVKTLAPKSEGDVVTKPLVTSHNTLMITIVVILATSLFIGIGFAYLWALFKGIWDL